MFIGRKNELAELERVYRQDGFHIFVLYGSDGAGKTTLLEEFCKDKDAVFFTAARESMRANLQRFSQVILTHYVDGYTKPFVFWQDALKYIFDNQADNQRVILVLDEFSELGERDTVFMNMFKKEIEQNLKDTKIFMIISSSDFKFLQKYFLDRVAPLNHRVTGQLLLERFALDDTAVEKLTEEAERTETGIKNARTKMQKVSADQIILRGGEINHEMYKIISGKAVCYFHYGEDNEYLFTSLKEGSCFGEYSLLTGKPGIYTVTAFTDMLIMRITKEDFTQFIEMNAKNSIDIMRNMAKMLNVMAVNIDMIRGDTQI